MSHTTPPCTKISNDARSTLKGNNRRGLIVSSRAAFSFPSNCYRAHLTRFRSPHPHIINHKPRAVASSCCSQPILPSPQADFFRSSLIQSHKANEQAFLIFFFSPSNEHKIVFFSAVQQFSLGNFSLCDFCLFKRSSISLRFSLRDFTAEMKTSSWSRPARFSFRCFRGVMMGMGD
jgi:hypothetical protein